jgi:23S rRNA (uracil1939-C5)-methyltransferase
VFRAAPQFVLSVKALPKEEMKPEPEAEEPTLEVEVERLLPGGLGLAYAEGRSIMVSLAAAGDRVRVRIEDQKGKVAFASIVEIIKPSPDRVEPPCPYFGICGGCTFQQLNYEAQLQAKSDAIRDCLHRITKIGEPPQINIVPSPEQWRYRARATWQFDPAGHKLGYYERGTHTVCDIAECAVLTPELEDVLEELRADLTNQGSGRVRQIEAAAGDADVSLLPPVGQFAGGTVSRKVGDETYQFSADSFFQTNHYLLSALVDAAVGNATGEMAVDLYSGVGLFTLPLARRFKQVVGVELGQRATEYARLNLKNASLENATVINQKVKDWLRGAPKRIRNVDFLLLDPPRTGAEHKSIQGILNLHPHHICYVSCDPATLARDLKWLLEGNYSIDSILGLDMFPQTHHVETVVHLVG